jgi:pimeloyl-ACP methyl ester carboxylesterase
MTMRRWCYDFAEGESMSDLSNGFALALVVILAAGAAAAQIGPNAAADLVVPMPVPVPAKEALATLPDTRLWYWDTGGDGPAVLLVHPATGSGLIWGYQQPALAKAGYRVIGYSRRSYHGSDPLPKDNPGIASEDLHNLVAFLGIGKFHVVGSAAGGGVAADYAVSHPDRLLSLVINSNPAGLSGGDIVNVYASLRPRGFAELPPDFRELGPSYRAANPAGVKAWLELEHQAVTSNPFRQRAANAITEATLRRLQVPTLLITGEADLYSPPALIRMVAAQIPGSEVAIIREAGHSSYWEQPEAFNRTVLDFLARHAK